MGRLERVREIARRLGSGRACSTDELSLALEVSRSTVKRDIAYLTDRLQAPVRWDAARGGWHLDAQSDGRVEVPGLWLSAEEIHGLLTMQRWLTSLDAGSLIEPHVAPLTRRLDRILGAGVPSAQDITRRIRIVAVGARRLKTPVLRSVGHALLERRQLDIGYRARSSGERSQRVVSPQRLVHYRDNWYLDAWCHRRESLRSFSVDAIESVQVLDAPALDVPEEKLTEALGAGYGIVAGQQVRQAVLRFTIERARWVAAERWHENQIGRWDAEGRWVLTVPYADPRELVMDILQHVPEVEVLGPDELRVELVARLRGGLKLLDLDA